MFYNHLPNRPGDGSAVIRDDLMKYHLVSFGCSLLKLVERRQYEPVSYEEAKTQLHLEIYQQYLEKAFREWMENLRAQTYIERKGHFAEAAMLGSKSGFAGPNEAEEDSRF